MVFIKSLGIGENLISRAIALSSIVGREANPLGLCGLIAFPLRPSGEPDPLAFGRPL
jgi:hypothetical protein